MISILESVPQMWINTNLFRWRNGFDGKSYNSFISDIVSSNIYIYKFTLTKGTVLVDGKKTNIASHDIRIQLTLEYLNKISSFFEFENLLIPICISDGAPDENYDFPIFSFDKIEGAEKILIPDTDYIGWKYYNNVPIDTNHYNEKACKAVFAGSSTGGNITIDGVKKGLNKRIKSAEYFIGNALVDFKITNVCSHDTEETRAYVKSLGVTSDRLSWKEQTKNKFIISVDGNACTFKRVIDILHSNSVLLKYHSNRMQYYYPSLVKWMHYIPISENADVINVVRDEINSPMRYKYISDVSTQFARDYLNECITDYYMIALLNQFARLVR